MKELKKVVFLTVVVVVLSIAANGCVDDDNYGALAYNMDTGDWGWSVDNKNQSDANARALKECGGGCEVVMGFHNTCAAFAVDNKKHYGWAYAPTEERAQELAMQYCKKKGSDCEIMVWACTTR